MVQALLSASAQPFVTPPPPPPPPSTSGGASGFGFAGSSPPFGLQNGLGASGPAQTPPPPPQSGFGTQQGTGGQSGGPQGGGPPPQTQSATQVVVVPDAKNNSYIYQILDSATGSLITEIPQITVQQVASDPNYSAGAYVNQRA